MNDTIRKYFTTGFTVDFVEICYQVCHRIGNGKFRDTLTFEQLFY